MATRKKPEKIKKDGTPDRRSGLPHYFKPGESGNPAGRPKRGHALTDQLRSMMASREIKVEVTITKINQDGDEVPEVKKWELKSSHDFNTIVSMAIIQKAVEGDVHAFNSIADRLEGRPVQTNVIADGAGEFRSLPIEEKQNILNKLLAKAIE